jgi:hypothetical protein
MTRLKMGMVGGGLAFVDAAVDSDASAAKWTAMKSYLS